MAIDVPSIYLRSSLGTLGKMSRKPITRKSMALTAELIARVERIEPDPGPEPGTSEHTDAEFDDLVERLLSEYRPETLWVFAYGSLIWNPEFTHIEQRPARAPGWHRSFCLKLTRWRGTRELPALMLVFDRGGSCNVSSTGCQRKTISDSSAS
ncbi:gamma-glutamylcyclotransferase [Mesorhizobium sp. M0938]|uniref:gamma-glutamylcyclotransferase n=1 Tax=unclassified Mesorhizobium TaxID=325217 RepID=UPI003337CE4E